MRPRSLLILLLVLVAPALAAPPEVEAGSKVTIEYTIFGTDGKKITATEKPFEMQIGSNTFLPDLQKGMVGMKAGESRDIVLTPDQAFGDVDPNLVGKVSASSLPEAGRKAGAVIKARDKNGREHIVRVVRIEGDQAVVDANHPWAGMTLKFRVKVLKLD